MSTNVLAMSSFVGQVCHLVPLLLDSKKPKEKKTTGIVLAPKHTTKWSTLFIVDYTKWAYLFLLQYSSLFCLGTRLLVFIVVSFSFPVEMMVVKPTGEVLVHYNANELLKVAEEDHIFTGAFS